MKKFDRSWLETNGYVSTSRGEEGGRTIIEFLNCLVISHEKKIDRERESNPH